MQTAKCGWVSAAVLSAVVALGAGVASAQEAPEDSGGEEEPQADSGAAKPWSKGVSEANRSKALGLFEQGNHFFERSQYQKALAEYSKAVEAWDHPAIRYNMAVCLINLDDPLKAHANLTKGLAFGQEPLSPELFAEGQTYMKLLEGRLSRVTISVKEAGVSVTLDGEDLFQSPGSETRLLLPGKHQVVANKAQMLTETVNVALEGGNEEHVEIKMRPLSEGVEMKRRWAAWKPWAVAGGSVGLALLGGFFYALADTNLTKWEARVAEQCPNGCEDSELSSGVRKRESRGELYSTLSGTFLITAGVVAATSGVLFFLNRKRPVNIEEAPPAEPAAISIAPVVGEDTVGMSAVMRF